MSNNIDSEILETFKAIDDKLQQLLHRQETLPQEIRPNVVYTTAEAAVLLRVGPGKVRTLCDSQKIQHQRSGTGKSAGYRMTGQAVLDFMNPPAIAPAQTNPRGRPAARRRASKRKGINA
ncbi:MAG: helix-turn-helix domain-containing protein [Fuerstiella sp.]|nr:helix-turn-helix domain-containing protein [Fuerstiella sp.]MCP4856211.1 helix-turn-helix domain-containing protein [Fuerstiella sp.]